jgi:hypothetical protein
MLFASSSSNVSAGVEDDDVVAVLGDGLACLGGDGFGGKVCKGKVKSIPSRLLNGGAQRPSPPPPPPPVSSPPPPPQLRRVNVKRKLKNFNISLLIF